MARPPTITDDQILEAAHDLFIEKGSDATTLEIAERAGCSEGTIFKRFQTKEQLFIAAMRQELDSNAWLNTLDQVVGQGELMKNLERISLEMVEFFSEMLPRIHMLMSQHQQIKRKIIDDPEAPPLRSLRHLTRFFAQEQALGRLADDQEPELLARLLIAAMHHYSFCQTSHINQWLPYSTQDYVRHTLSLLFEQLLLTPSPLPPPSCAE